LEHDDRDWLPEPYSVIGSPFSAWTMKFDTTRPSLGWIRGPDEEGGIKR
jgi:hypothetical protein